MLQRYMVYATLGGRVPVRYLTLLLLVWTFMVYISMRAIMSVAVPVMGSGQQRNSSAAAPDSTVAQPSNETVIEGANQSSTMADTWTDSSRDLIFSSYYWGYLFTQVAGGIMVEMYGSKLVLGVSQGVSGVLILAIPTLAHHFGSTSVVVVRFVLGLLAGPINPGMFPLIARWFPANERHTVNSVLQAVQLMCVAITFSASGVVVTTRSWQMVFYVAGGVALLWLLAWIMFMCDSPEQHPAISKHEVIVITGDQSAVSCKPRAPPLLSMILSAPVWTIAACEFANSMGQTFLFNYIPTFIKEVVGIDLNKSALFSSVPYVGRAVTCVFVGLLGDLTLRRKWLSVINIRRLSMVISFGGSAVMLFLITQLDAHIGYVTVILSVAAILSSFASLGHALNTIDISPSFCGTVFGIANTCAGLSAMLNPLIATAVVTDRSSHSQWHIMFYIVAAVYLVSTVQYVLFVSVDRQKWDPPQECRESREVTPIDKVKSDC